MDVYYSTSEHTCQWARLLPVGREQASLLRTLYDKCVQCLNCPRVARYTSTYFKYYCSQFTSRSENGNAGITLDQSVCQSISPSYLVSTIT